MYNVTISSHFDAAHFIEGMNSPCARLHGHTWRVETTIRGNKINGLGLLVDFAWVKKMADELIDKEFDHRCLNEMPGFEQVNPTAENIAEYLFWNFKLKVTEIGLELTNVRVYESGEAWVDYNDQQVSKM